MILAQSYWKRFHWTLHHGRRPNITTTSYIKRSSISLSATTPINTTCSICGKSLMRSYGERSSWTPGARILPLTFTRSRWTTQESISSVPPRTQMSSHAYSTFGARQTPQCDTSRGTPSFTKHERNRGTSVLLVVPKVHSLRII
jgi:hypothetical protein